MTAVTVIFVHKMGHENQDVDRTPANRKQHHHGDHVLLRTFLLSEVDVVVMVVMERLAVSDTMGLTRSFNSFDIRVVIVRVQSSHVRLDVGMTFGTGPFRVHPPIVQLIGGPVDSGLI